MQWSEQKSAFTVKTFHLLRINLNLRVILPHLCDWLLIKVFQYWPLSIDYPTVWRKTAVCDMLKCYWLSLALIHTLNPTHLCGSCTRGVSEAPRSAAPLSQLWLSSFYCIKQTGVFLSVNSQVLRWACCSLHLQHLRKELILLNCPYLFVGVGFWDLKMYSGEKMQRWLSKAGGQSSGTIVFHFTFNWMFKILPDVFLYYSNVSYLTLPLTF